MKLLITILFIFSFDLAKSQIAIGYSIGVLGENFKIDNYSNPLVITSKSCILVTNGVSKYFLSGKGIYLNACAEKETEIKLKIILAPNPATDYTVLKFASEIFNQDRFSIQLFNSSGLLINNYVAKQSQLLAGFRITTNSLAQGIYFIKIFSTNINEVVKFIKN